MNRRGQAAVEALVCSVVWLFGIIFLLKTGLRVNAILLLDDWTDEYLLCKNEICTQKFHSRLKAMGISAIIENSEHGQLSLTAESPVFGTIKIRKESTL
jgi:hypothetical protein